MSCHSMVTAVRYRIYDASWYIIHFIATLFSICAQYARTLPNSSNFTLFQISLHCTCITLLTISQGTFVTVYPKYSPINIIQRLFSPTVQSWEGAPDPLADTALISHAARSSLLYCCKVLSRRAQNSPEPAAGKEFEGLYAPLMLQSATALMYQKQLVQ